MEERMAEHPNVVKTFLERLLEKSMPQAKKEIADLKTYIKKQGCNDEFMPWDYAFWSNKLKEEH